MRLSDPSIPYGLGSHPGVPQPLGTPSDLDLQRRPRPHRHKLCWAPLNIGRSQRYRLGRSRVAVRVAIGGAMHQLAVAVGGLRRQLGVERQLLGAVVRRLGRRVWVAACATYES